MDYTAASDALTYAPEDFNEFFNQRRRWMPSTMANIMDLLSDARNTVLRNDNISYLYILYQAVLLAATVLGPSTIILAIASAVQSVTNTKLWIAYMLTMAPTVIFLIMCFACKTKTQLTAAALISTLYTCVMVMVMVGILQSIATESLLNPSLFFLALVVVCFLFAGLLHPYEISCLVHGILYFLTIPSGYLILVIYSMSNMHVVSWGTREVPKRKSKAEREAESQQAKTETVKKEKKSFLSFLKPSYWLHEIKDSLSQIAAITKETNSQKEMVKQLKNIRKEIQLLQRVVHGEETVNLQNEQETEAVPETEPEETKPEEEKPATVEFTVTLDDRDDPNWIKDPRLKNGTIEQLSDNETLFWTKMIKKYLEPLKKDKEQEKKNNDALITLRNNVSFGFWLVNALWVLFNYMIMVNSHLSTVNIFGLDTNPAGFIFMILFVFVLLLQMIGMVMHRWGTLLQVVAVAELRNPLKKIDPGEALEDNKKISPEEAVNFTKKLQSAIQEEPAPDYDDDGPSDTPPEPPRMRDATFKIDQAAAVNTLRIRTTTRPDVRDTHGQSDDRLYSGMRDIEAGPSHSQALSDRGPRLRRRQNRSIFSHGINHIRRFDANYRPSDPHQRPERHDRPGPSDGPRHRTLHVENPNRYRNNTRFSHDQMPPQRRHHTGHHGHHRHADPGRRTVAPDELERRVNRRLARMIDDDRRRR